MRQLYEAANGLEAHMIVNLLEQQGLKTRIDGEYLQGGIGELPAAGLVRIMIAPEDYAAGRDFIQRWDAEQPRQATPARSDKRRLHLGALALGLALGAASTYGFLRTPVKTSGIDLNGDGIADERWTYSPSGRATQQTMDRNFDGRIDWIARYDVRGQIDTAEADDDFNGSFETRYVYRRGNVELVEVDTDGDTVTDLRWRNEHGVLVRGEFLDPTTARPVRVEHYRLGKMTHAELDTDADGRMDTRISYDRLGEPVRREAILPSRP
jgi:Putative prokaryotic signal transducing protein